jgi:hypothetical protein
VFRNEYVHVIVVVDRGAGDGKWKWFGAAVLRWATMTHKVVYAQHRYIYYFTCALIATTKCTLKM